MRFINFTGAVVTVQFEGGVLEPGTWDFPASAAEEKEFAVSTVPRGRFKYFGKVAGSATVNLDGESSPEIIVDRVTTPMA